MIKSSIEKIARDIGFDIANSDDVTQSNLLNGMGDAFKTYRSEQMDMQMCYVSDKLNSNAIQFIKQLHKFIEDK